MRIAASVSLIFAAAMVVASATSNDVADFAGFAASTAGASLGSMPRLFAAQEEPAHPPPPPAHDAPRHRGPIEKHDKSAPIDVTSSDWWWIPPLVGVLFMLFYASTNRVKRLENKSLRIYLMRHFSAEPLHEGTFAGASAHVMIEQKRCEYGHQALNAIAIVALALDWGLNSNRDERYAVSILAALQLLGLVCSTAVDLLLLRAGYIRPVRTVNTKLRYAHCPYQVVLFCADALSTGFSLSMPIDCFVWATTHYMYEAIAICLEGLNLFGLSDLTLILSCNAVLILSAEATTGWRCAFALTSLGLSSVTLLIGIAWKLTHLHPEDRLLPEVELAAAAEGAHGGHDDHTSAGGRHHPHGDSPQNSSPVTPTAPRPHSLGRRGASRADLFPQPPVVVAPAAPDQRL
jgi:hypothetical protein